MGSSTLVVKLTGKIVLQVAEGVVGLLWLLVERDEGLCERLEDALLLEIFAKLLSLGVDHVRAPRGGRGVAGALDGGGHVSGDGRSG